VEALEGRDVPVFLNVWTGAVSTDFDTAAKGLELIEDAIAAAEKQLL
jgi:hypothetical protein